jgi:hypothetical protein
MMEAETVSEMLGFYPQLTRLVAREEFKQYKTTRQSAKSKCSFWFDDDN